MPPAEFASIVAATAPKYLAGAKDNTIRKRLVFAMARKKGRITQGHDGLKMIWVIQHDEPPVEARGTGSPVTYAQNDVFRQLETNWREYNATDAMPEKHRLMNAGTSALVKYYDGILPRLTKSVDNKLNGELYVDGYATGNENRFCGFDSFTGTGTTVAADKIAYPSDTYAEKSTVPGTAGSWSADYTTSPNAALDTDWPDGSGTPSYDWLSPKLVNWSSSSWGTSSQTWAGNCEVVLRQAKIWCAATSGVDGAPSVAMMTAPMFNDFKTKQASKQNIWVPHKEADDLGFPDTLNFEGMALNYEYGVPVNSCYGFNLMEMELRILGDKFYQSHGPDWDPGTKSWVFSVGVYGNIAWNPKAHFKCKNYAT
jgi:hypothetical protein